MGRINAAWHKANPMPKNPTLDQRIEWHAVHAAACGCRELTPKLREEFKRRALKIPKPPKAPA